MPIVFPEGSGCVQRPADLAFVRTLGAVDHYETLPQNTADLIQRLRDADAVFLNSRALLEILSITKLSQTCSSAEDRRGGPRRPRGGARTHVATLPNVLVTPHIAYNSKEAGENMLRIAYAPFDAFLKGGKLHVVNAV